MLSKLILHLYAVVSAWPFLHHSLDTRSLYGYHDLYGPTSSELFELSRMSIDTEGEINHQMSPQSLISCNTHGQSGCNGGYIDRAWHFLRKFG